MGAMDTVDLMDGVDAEISPAVFPVRPFVSFVVNPAF